MAYSHTYRPDGFLLTHTAYNADHQNHIDNMTPDNMDDWSTDQVQMDTHTDPYPGGTPSLATDLSDELERLRFVLRAMHGGSNWYEDTGVLAALGSANTFTGINTYDDRVEYRGLNDSAAVAIHRVLKKTGASARFIEWLEDTTHATARYQDSLYWTDTVNELIRWFTDGTGSFGSPTDQATPTAGDWNAVRLLEEGKSHTLVESAQQTITINTDISVAHGLPARPKEFGAYIECTHPSGEHGYANGDYVAVSTVNAGSQTTINAAYANATNVGFAVSNNITVITKNNPANAGIITPARWALRLWWREI